MELLAGMFVVILAVLAHRSLAFFDYRPLSTKVSTTLKGSSQLEQLADMTVVSCDSGDLDVLAKFSATGLITDATTNPLFVSQAGSNGDARYIQLVEAALTYAKEISCNDGGCDIPSVTLNLAVDRLSVLLGAEISKVDPSYLFRCRRLESY